MSKHTLDRWPAHGEGIADGRIRTGAYGHVIGNRAKGSDSAGADTRILALVPETGLRVGTVGVGQALGIAADVGIASVVGQTLADGVLEALAAVGVDSAGRRRARTMRLRLWLWFWNKADGI